MLGFDYSTQLFPQSSQLKWSFHAVEWSFSSHKRKKKTLLQTLHHQIHHTNVIAAQTSMCFVLDDNGLHKSIVFMKPQILIFTRNAKAVGVHCIFRASRYWNFGKQMHTLTHRHVNRQAYGDCTTCLLGTAAVWVACLFSANNQSHKASEAWLEITGQESDMESDMCVWRHLCTLLLHNWCMTKTESSSTVISILSSIHSHTNSHTLFLSL